MKVLVGFLLGLSIALLMGAAMESKPVGVYRPAFSGITSEGACYLAVTNTITGRTEIFGIPKEVLIKIGKEPFQITQQGTAIVKPSQ
jgi:hypothetical protein